MRAVSRFSQASTTDGMKIKVAETEQNSKQHLDNLSSYQRHVFEEEDMRPNMHGVVAINIVGFSFTSDSYPMGQNTNYFLHIRNRSTAKQTGPLTASQNRIIINQLKHIPLPSRPKDIECLGSVGFHVYDVVDSSPWASSFEFWNDTYLVGMLELEFTFNYGSFGYGHSIQLENEGKKPNENVRFSLLPRIIPPPEQREPNSCVLITKAVPHPDYIPFDNRTRLSYGREIDASELVPSLQINPTVIKGMESRIDSVRKHYCSIKDRTERLAFLQKYLSKDEVSKGGQVPLLNSVGVVNSSSTGTGPVIYGMMRDYVRFVEPIIVKDSSKGQETATKHEKGIIKKFGGMLSNPPATAKPKSIRKTAEVRE